MKKTALFLALLLALATPFSVRAETVAEAVMRARQLEMDFEIYSAIDIYDAIIAQFPEQFPEIYVYRAGALLRLGMVAADYDGEEAGKLLQEAIADYGKALELDAGDPQEAVLDHQDIYKERAEAKLYAGDPEGAIADYDRALVLRPDDRFVLSDRAGIKLGIGDCTGAAADYSAAMELDDEPGSLDFEGRAISRLCLGDLTGALNDFRKVNLLVKGVDSNHLYFHRSYLDAWALEARLGRKDEADRLLAEELAAVTVDPSDIDQDYNLALYALGRVEESVLYSGAATLNARNPDYGDLFDCEAYYLAGLKQFGDGNTVEARGSFEKVLSCQNPYAHLRELSQGWIGDIDRGAPQ